MSTHEPLELGKRIWPVFSFMRAVELRGVAPDFSAPYSILSGNPLILGLHPNLGGTLLLLADHPLFPSLIPLF